MNEQQEEISIMEQDKNSVLKLVFLGVISLVLCASGPLSMFATVPLCLVPLLFGRTKGLILVAIGFLITIGMANISLNFTHVWVVYLYAALSSIIIYEMILRKLNPTKGVVVSGLLVLGVIATLFFTFSMSTDTSLEMEVEKSVMTMIEMIKSNNENAAALNGTDEKSIALREFIDKPKVFVTRVMNWLPALVFVSAFFTVWVSFFLLLRNAHLWSSRVDYPYTLKDLTNFKLPDFFVWPLILGLVLFAGGEYVFGPNLEIIGVNLLFSLGVFYFFQGFGIYLDALTHFKIFGLFRTLLIMMTLFMAWQVVVIAGVFDTWVNFRKFFIKKKQNDEGDIL
ncbi:MAG: DUF2232 domain-containing protein [Bacteriovoracaceae bacterium]|jgi:hypothetical protein|nr:DUF2232 domain-containing protein [Bacteriovoracaceae bacterium]